MLTGKRILRVVLAVGVLVLVGGAASADIVHFTFEVTVTPYSMEQTGYDPPEYLYGTPFDVTIDLCADFQFVQISEGSPNWITAQGVVVAWAVTGDTWSEYYDPATFQAGLTELTNNAMLTAFYLDDPVLGIVPLNIMDGAAVVGGCGQLPEGLVTVEAVLIPEVDPILGQVTVTGHMMRQVITGSQEDKVLTETGYTFTGTLTGYSVGECVVPEPATLVLLTLGVGAIATLRTGKRRAA